MSKIQNYTNDSLIKGSDKVLGSSFENNLWVTRNYTINSLASFFVNYLSQNGVSYDLASMTTSIDTNSTSISTINTQQSLNTTNISANATYSTNLAASFGTVNADGSMASFSQAFANQVFSVTASDRFATSTYANNLASSVGTYDANGNLQSMSQSFANSVMTTTNDSTFATSSFVNNLGSSFGTVASDGTVTISESFANEVLTTTSNADFASTTYVNNLGSSFGTVGADGTVTPSTAFANTIMNLETATDYAEASTVSSLSTTVGNNTSAISINQNSINGVQSKYGVTLDTNGAVTGFQIISGANAQSDFIVTANKFKIYSSNGELTPFSVITDGSTSKVQINGNLNVSDTVTIEGSGDFSSGDGSINDLNGRPTALLMRAGAVAGDIGSVCLEMQSDSRWHHVIKTTGGTDEDGNFDLNAEYRLGKSLVVGNEGDNFSRIMMKLNGAGLIIPNQSANSVTPSPDYASGMNIIFNNNNGGRNENSGRMHVSEYYKTFFLDIPSNPLTTGPFADITFAIRKYVPAVVGPPAVDAYETKVAWIDNSDDSWNVDGDVNATAFNTTSDYRLKEDFQSFNGLNIINNINVYDFKWKDVDDVEGKRAYGVKAHELQEQMPSAVTGEQDGNKMQKVDYSKLVPVLIKSIQELQAQVQQLQNP
jgi:hypothetical protein